MWFSRCVWQPHDGSLPRSSSAGSTTVHHNRTRSFARREASSLQVRDRTGVDGVVRRGFQGVPCARRCATSSHFWRPCTPSCPMQR
jgi:hypothetical protein